jgi:hypothetical protein
MFQFLWSVSMSTQDDLIQYSGMQTTWGSLRVHRWFMACQVGVEWLLNTKLAILLFYLLSVLFIQHHLNLQSLLHTPEFDKIKDYCLGLLPCTPSKYHFFCTHSIWIHFIGMTDAHKHMTAPIMKLDVFISLDKPRECDLLTPEKFQRDTNFKIPLWNNFQINFLQTFRKPPRLKSNSGSTYLMAQSMRWYTTQLLMTTKKKWNLWQHNCFPLLQNNVTLQQAVTRSFRMEECVESMTKTPNGTKIKSQLFVNNNYTNPLQHLNFWRPLTGVYSKGW